MRLTMRYWVNLYPGNGTWTVRLRNHLYRTIHYQSDLGNVPQFIKYFVDENKAALNCGSITFTQCLNKFFDILASEVPKTTPIKIFPIKPAPIIKQPPKIQPPIKQPGGVLPENGFDFQKLLIPAALLAAAYFLLS